MGRVERGGRFGVLGFAAALAAGAGPGPAPTPPGTDTPPAVRDGGEIEALQARVKELEAANAALTARVRELQVLVERLRGGAAPGWEPPPGPTPADPLSSPASLGAELRRRYARDLSDLPRSTPGQAAAYKKRVQEWTEEINRDLRGRARWLVRFGEIREVERGKFETVMTVLDDATFLPIGEGRRVPVPDRFVDRVRSMERAREREREKTGRSKPWAWELHVHVSAAVAFRPDVSSSGIFNVVELVGSYAEFGFALEWRGLSDVDLPVLGAEDVGAEPATGVPNQGEPR